MEILGLIPARQNSVRIKHKNWVDLGGKPLIQWTFDAANDADLSRIIVCTDDPLVESLAATYNFETMYQPSPFNKGTEHASHLCMWVLEYLKKAENYIPDGLFLLFPTSPFRTSANIATANNHFRWNKGTLIGVCETRPIECLRRVEDKYLVPYVDYKKLNVQSQDTPETFLVNGAVFLTQPELLFRHRSFHLSKSRMLLMPKKNSIEIDTPDDLEFARSLV